MQVACSSGEYAWYILKDNNRYFLDFQVCAGPVDLSRTIEILPEDIANLEKKSPVDTNSVSIVEDYRQSIDVSVLATAQYLSRTNGPISMGFKRSSVESDARLMTSISSAIISYIGEP